MRFSGEIVETGDTFEGSLEGRRLRRVSDRARKWKEGRGRNVLLQCEYACVLPDELDEHNSFRNLGSRSGST